MISDFLKKRKAQQRVDRLYEEKLYQVVGEEISSGVRYEGLWIKALADADGSDERAKSLYIKYRAQAIIDELSSQEEERKENESKQSRDDTQNKYNEQVERNNRAEQNRAARKTIEQKITALETDLHHVDKIYDAKANNLSDSATTSFLLTLLFIAIIFVTVFIFDQISSDSRGWSAPLGMFIGMIVCALLSVNASERRYQKVIKSDEYKSLIESKKNEIEKIEREIYKQKHELGKYT